MVVMALRGVANAYQTFTKSQGLSKQMRQRSSLNFQNNPSKEALSFIHIL